MYKVKIKKIKKTKKSKQSKGEQMFMKYRNSDIKPHYQLYWKRIKKKSEKRKYCMTAYIEGLQQLAQKTFSYKNTLNQISAKP